MRIIALLFAMFVLFQPFNSMAEKTDIAEYDGSDWSVWQPSHKYNFISGFISGVGYIVNNNIEQQKDNYESDKASNVFWSYSFQDEKKPKNKYTRQEISDILGYKTETSNVKLFSYSIYNITNDQIVDGLNQLYTDYKNKQIKLRDAIYVIKKQIKGASPEEIEATLLFLRSDKNFSKRFFTEKDGKKKYVTFP